MFGALLLRERGHAVRERRVGEDAGDHDVLAVEQTHGRRNLVVPPPAPRCALRPCGATAPCARLSAMRIGIWEEPDRQAARSAARLASVGYDVGHRLAVEVPGDGGPRRAWSRSGPTSTPLLDATATTPRPPTATSSSSPRRGTRRPPRRRRTRPYLAGKVVVSMANALVRVGHEFQPLVPPRGSVAAHVQAAVPQCRVVAAFHHLPATELGHIGEPIDSDVLICGDDPTRCAPSARSWRRSPAAARSTPASCRTRRRSRRSPPCCCS